MDSTKDSKVHVYHLIGKLVHGGLEKQVSLYSKFSVSNQITHHIVSTNWRVEKGSKLYGEHVLGGVLELIKYLNSKENQTIHCHTTKAVIIGFFINLIKRNITLTFHVHTYQVMNYGWLRLFLFRFKKIIAVNSDLSKKAKEVFKFDNVCTIPNGLVINTENIVNTEKDIFGYVGRLEPEKNVLEIPKLIKSINEKYGVYVSQIIIFGEGSLKDDLTRLLKKNQIEYKFISGEFNPVNIYKSFGTLLVPSKIESFSLSTIEALIHGKHVFTNDKVSYDLFKGIFQEKIRFIESDNITNQSAEIRPIKKLNQLNIHHVIMKLETMWLSLNES